jgi:hypothetical protein
VPNSGFFTPKKTPAVSTRPAASDDVEDSPGLVSTAPTSWPYTSPQPPQGRSANVMTPYTPTPVHREQIYDPSLTDLRYDFTPPNNQSSPSLAGSEVPPSEFLPGTTTTPTPSHITQDDEDDTGSENPSQRESSTPRSLTTNTASSRVKPSCSNPIYGSVNGVMRGSNHPYSTIAFSCWVNPGS